MHPLIKLLRPRQWYKNLVIFAALLYSGSLFDNYLLFMSILGFAIFSTVASANYIINDIVDRHEDRKHPEKKNRPIASGKISIKSAIATSTILFIVGLFFGFLINRLFGELLVVYTLLTIVYTLLLKKEQFIDTLVIATNFVIRALAGAVIIRVKATPWLITVVFFITYFIAVSKRRADNILTRKASNVNYDFAIFISAALTIMSYSLYTFLERGLAMLITIPIVIYAIQRYVSLIFSKSIIARQPERGFSDARLLVSFILWLVLTIIILY